MNKIILPLPLSPHVFKYLLNQKVPGQPAFSLCTLAIFMNLALPPSWNNILTQHAQTDLQILWTDLAFFDESLYLNLCSLEVLAKTQTAEEFEANSLYFAIRYYFEQLTFSSSSFLDSISNN